MSGRPGMFASWRHALRVLASAIAVSLAMAACGVVLWALTRAAL